MSAARIVWVAAVAVLTVACPPPPEPQYGSIAVSSSPAGARIWIDAEDTGEVTPGSIEDIRPGDHELGLRLENYRDWDSTVVVEENQTTFVEAELAPRLGAVAVASDPPGAAIFLDGEDTGLVTPDTLSDILVGAHEIVLKKENYRDWLGYAVVEEGELVRIEALLERKAGDIFVASDPEGASIWLNGEATGRLTPATLTELPLGTYTVRVELSGYHPDSQSVSLDSDRETRNAEFVLRVKCPGDNVVGDPALEPEIEIVGLQFGDRTIRGIANNIDLGENIRVVLWAQTDHYYVQPYINSPWTRICGDGTWENGTHPWDRIVAVLVDADIYVPGAIRYLHPALDPGVIAWDEFPEARIIEFGGYRWIAKVSEKYRVGPGPNFFSNRREDIWKDDLGVHLTTSHHDGKWWSTEMVMEEHLGYGEYEFTEASRIDSLDYRAVFAGFIYESLSEEIDVEFSRYLADPYNAQYVIQPYSTQGNIERYDMPPAAVSTHRFLWLADRIVFTSWRGDAPEPTAETLIHTWTYTGGNIPSPDNERMRFNLWLFNGATPLGGQGDEVVVRSFSYKP